MPENFGEAGYVYPNPSDVFRDLQDKAQLRNIDLSLAFDVSKSTICSWRRGRSVPPGAALAYLRLFLTHKNRFKADIDVE